MKFFVLLISALSFYMLLGCSSVTDSESKNHAPSFGYIHPGKDSSIYAGNTVKFYAMMIDCDKDIAGIKIFINDELLSNSEQPGYEADTLYLNGISWKIDQCLAGSYKIRLELSDKAGNVSDTTYSVNLKKLHEWSKTYSAGEGWRAAQTTDSGFVINANSSLIKLDKNGSKLWQNSSLSASLGAFMPFSVCALRDNNIYIAKNVFGLKYTDSVTICKLTGSGAVIWKKSLPGGALRKMMADSQENLYLATIRKIYKFNCDGEEIWTKDYNDNLAEIYSIPENEIITAGASKFPNNSDSVKVNLQKLNQNGLLVWEKKVSIDAVIASYPYMFLDKATNGDYLVAIRTLTLLNGCPMSTVQIIRFDSDGFIKYMKKIYFPYDFELYRLVADRNNGFFLVTSFGIDKFDSEGLLIEKIYNGALVYDLIPTFDGRYFMCGAKPYSNSDINIWGAKATLDLKSKKQDIQKNWLEKKGSLK